MRTRVGVHARPCVFTRALPGWGSPRAPRAPLPPCPAWGGSIAAPPSGPPSAASLQEKDPVPCWGGTHGCWAPRSPPPSPQPCPRCPEVPVEALRRRRGVQGVAPLVQSHGTVGPAAAGCCPGGSGWVGGSCWGPPPHPHTPPIGPRPYRRGQAAGSRTSGRHGRRRGGKWAAWSGWCCWPAAAPTATATAPARPAGTRGGGGTQRVSPPEVPAVTVPPRSIPKGVAPRGQRVAV